MCFRYSKGFWGLIRRDGFCFKMDFKFLDTEYFSDNYVVLMIRDFFFVLRGNVSWGRGKNE